MDNKPPFISEFIELYRQQTCLWKIKDDNYANRRKKDEAYAVLLEFYQKTIPSASVDCVKKKIYNLRCAFRKELKKVRNQKSGSSGDDAYTPSLWYYDLLLFSADQEETRETIGSDDYIALESTDETSSYLRQSSSQLPSAPPSPGGSCSDSVPLAISTSSRKSKKANSTMRRNEAIDAAMKALKEDDEFDGIGLNVACKLRRMNQDQQLYAEMLINKVLLNGMKGRLQEETDVCALKFMRPLIPVRPTERQIFFYASAEVNDHIQTPPNNTNDNNPPSVGVAQCINQTDEDDPLSKYLIL